MSFLCCCTQIEWYEMLVILFFVFVFVLSITGIVSDIYKNREEASIKMKEIENAHEKMMKELSYKREDELLEKDNKRREDELERKLKEFQCLTIRQKMLEKVLDKTLEDKTNDLEEKLKLLIEKYESLNTSIDEVFVKFSSNNKTK